MEGRGEEIGAGPRGGGGMTEGVANHASTFSTMLTHADKGLTHIQRGEWRRDSSPLGGTLVFP